MKQLVELPLYLEVLAKLFQVTMMNIIYVQIFNVIMYVRML